MENIVTVCKISGKRSGGVDYLSLFFFQNSLLRNVFHPILYMYIYEIYAEKLSYFAFVHNNLLNLKLVKF